ncbi:uncharacterized protein LOC129249280 [Anastrepha obliqua]|uniref:uncharacterized protein LOC129249280 n=1 Tax=Anastrepha obliqua TaxID=95512 RepID=UPI0024096254|nr:uncharacterized protein LOC129249280 [Anastrepha obliqua]
MSTTELWFDDLSDDERLAELDRSRKQLRGASNPLEMASTEFLKNFRSSKEAFMNILSSTENQLQQCTQVKSSSLFSKKSKLLMCVQPCTTFACFIMFNFRMKSYPMRPSTMMLKILKWSQITEKQKT